MTIIHLCGVCQAEISREDDGKTKETFLEDRYDGCEERTETWRDDY